eukprot:222056-Alexandrium_andersonii.AAC.1
MQGFHRRLKAARAEQWDHYRLRKVELEVGEVRAGLEDLHDAREVVVVREDDCRAIGKGEDNAIVSQCFSQPAQEE